MSQFWRNTLLYYARFLRRYHRFSVNGLEHVLSDGAKLLVSYHGRGLPMDLGLVAHEVFLRKGYLPHAIMHRRLWDIPVVRDMVDGWGAIPGEVSSLEDAIARGESIMVTPGGTREALRRFDTRYRVNFGGRRGYLKLALKHGLSIIPVASWGVDERFIGLNDAHAISERLGIKTDLPLWVGVGLGGVFPVALPWPVRIHTEIGAPIDLHAATTHSPDSAHNLEELNNLITGRIQDLLEQARAGHKHRDYRGVLS